MTPSFAIKKKRLKEVNIKGLLKNKHKLVSYIGQHTVE
jgi:hypothetical protein